MTNSRKTLKSSKAKRTSRPPLRIRHARTSGQRTDVGYGRPPAEHQFKPGQSGNPRGRPKGSRNEATIIAELLNRKIAIDDNGKVRTISLLEGILRKFAQDALKGNAKAAAFLFNRKLFAESSEQPATTILDADDRKALEFFTRQVEEKFKHRKE